MVKALVVVAFLVVAQLIPSCGDRSETGGSPAIGTPAQVVGWVDEKRRDTYGVSPWLIVINHLEYGVPYEFWLAVEIGDLVRYDGQTWRIVRRARG